MPDRLHPEPQTEAQVQFAAVRQLMFANFDSMVRDFQWSAWYLGQVASDAEVPTEVRAVAEFALIYHARDIDAALAPVQKRAVLAGIPVNVSIPHAASEQERPGLLVGLTDAKYVDGQRVIEGVAAIKHREGQWAFVNVAMRENGDTVLLSEDHQRHDPDVSILLAELLLGVGR